ncbi:alpha/beta hydrolase family protein [Phenylobacterium sp.]|jgi:predicted alpha/beta-hydrolase family hydrolase|uniref:alpha/beta hydrolase family protein n=1 Tax=Phenylobacterium sp. TaxID=1871053 RepID=UPI0037844CC4
MLELRSSILALTVGLFVATSALSAPANVVTPRGAPILVEAQVPPGPGPFPAVVLAPGTGSMRQPLNDAVAASLRQQGFAVFRFEWAYYVRDKGSTPSDTDRGPEIEELTTVVDLARADARIDRARIFVGGKSRGSIIAWRVFRADPTLRGAVQLTPVCTKAGFTPAQLYPEIALETRPSLWVHGDVDPACRSRTLHGFLASAGERARSVGLRGDHGLSSATTSALAGALTADFVRSAAE